MSCYVPFMFDEFSVASRSYSFLKGLREDRLLNYVWINKEPVTSENTQDYQCAIPLSYLDRAYQNAHLYPDTEVKIWLDFDLLDSSSVFFLESHLYFHAPENVNLCNLRDIPAYARSSAFAPDANIGIWNRVDFARFIVLSHALEKGCYKQVFYSDFDVEDVDLDNPVTGTCLKEKGIAFGELKDGAPVVHGLWNYIAHGYIAVDRSREAFLKDELLPALTSAAEKNYKISIEIFRSIFMEIHKAGGCTRRGDMKPYFTSVAIHPIGWTMPANHDYENLRLCPPSVR